MHTLVTKDGTRFHYNSDFSGSLIIGTGQEGESVEIPMEALREVLLVFKLEEDFDSGDWDSIKGYIDEYGDLVKGNFYQRCIHNPSEHCNIKTCPAFREPIKEMSYPHDLETPPSPTGKVILEMCTEVGFLTFDEFRDERK